MTDPHQNPGRNAFIIDHFNRAHPIGALVDYRIDPAEPRNVQRVEGRAHEISPGRLVVKISGHDEPVELRHLISVDHNFHHPKF